jgi:hypothetical protein
LHPRSRTCRPCRHPDHGGHLQRHQWCTRGGRLDRRCDWRPFRYTGEGWASGCRATIKVRGSNRRSERAHHKTGARPVPGGPLNPGVAERDELMRDRP